MITALFPLLTIGAMAPRIVEDVPKATLKFAKATAAPGEKVKATLTVVFATGLHGYQNPPALDYQIPVSVKVVEKGFTLAKANYPKGVEMTVAGELSRVYEGEVTIPLELKASTKPGNYNVNVQVNYQQCTESSCYPPNKVVAKAKLVVKKEKKA